MYTESECMCYVAQTEKYMFDFFMQVEAYMNYVGLEGFKRYFQYYKEQMCDGMQDTYKYIVNYLNEMPDYDTAGYDGNVFKVSAKSRADIGCDSKREGVKKSFETACEIVEQAIKSYSEYYNTILTGGHILSADKIDCKIKKLEKMKKRLKRFIVEMNNLEWEPKRMELVQNELHKKYKRKVKRV